MTTLASLAFPHTGRSNGKTAIDFDSLIASVVTLQPPPGLSLTAAIIGWINQDDDAHEPCSLTACRHPLHPGPCKGWKGTLHDVSPGTYRQIEEARVKKANERRVKRIAELKSQGKPIPRRLLTEIQPKPAPSKPAPAHNAHNVSGVPLGQVNQKADLAGGTAHTAGQNVSKAAGVQVKTPLPLGPKKQKPTVAGRGPAFVITQPKVTDTYKLDKADKLTPADWAGLSDADKTTIRNELTAIKARGFGPQQKKADELLAKLPAPGSKPATSGPGNLTPGAPGTITTPGGHTYQKVSTVPGKTTLGQASKAPAPQHTIGGPPKTHAPAAPAAKTPITAQVEKALDPSAKLTPAARLFIHRQMTKADFDSLSKDNQAKVLEDLDHQIHSGYGVRTQKLAQTVKDTLAPGAPAVVAEKVSPADIKVGDVVHGNLVSGTHTVARIGHGTSQLNNTATAYDLYDKDGNHVFVGRSNSKVTKITKADGKSAPSTSPAAPGTAAPSTPAAPAPSPGLKPAAPMAPGTPAHVQHANAVANRTAPKAQTAKAQVDAYDKLTKADFDTLDPAAQKTIRDDLANAKAKFLDPKKQQAAADLLDRFGSRHPAPAAGPAAPAVPAGHPKGYSDPMQEAVKAASSGMISTDDILKTTGRLSPQTIGQLDDADRKKIIGRLAFIATHAKATPDQKDRAAALKRIIETGSPASTSRKWDHDPTLAELHADEKTGTAKGAIQVADALIAADAKTMPVDARLKDLGALSKADFDKLPADQQKKITDALHDIHTGQRDKAGVTIVNKDAEKALTAYTGVHPAVHTAREAEADFNDGKIDAEQFYSRFLTARVSTNGNPAAQKELAAEAQSIAERNTKLPLWLRASMIDSPYSNTAAYYSISQAGNRFNWEPAPRLSSSDITAIFRADVDELAKSNPVHREAVLSLRSQIIHTGLKGDAGVPNGSPWSDATRNHVVDNLLHISGSDHEVPAARLKEFNDLDPTARIRVQSVIRKRIAQQTSPHAKTGSWLTLRQLENHGTLSADAEEAVKAAAVTYNNPLNLERYRKLPSGDYANFPPYVQDAIQAHLSAFQARAESRPMGLSWGRNDNPFKVMPGALAADLKNDRTVYNDRNERNAADFARFGTKIIDTDSRLDAHKGLKRAGFDAMDHRDQAAILDDLDKIQNDTSLTLQQRYDALFTTDMSLLPTSQVVSKYTTDQVMAFGSVNPANPISDSTVITHLSNLSKADYDGLPSVYRDAVDARVKTLPSGPQQMIQGTLHPGAPISTPGGFTPTSGTPAVPLPPHIQTALDTLYGVHPKAHTMAHQLSAYGALRGADFNAFNGQEQGQLLGDLSFIATTAKGPSSDKAKKLIDRFTPPGTPAGQVPTGAIVPPVNAVAGQVRYATPLKGLKKAKDSGKSGDGWFNQGGQRVWGQHGAAGLMLQHVDPQSGEKRYLMVQRGPAISDPGKWTFPGGASDSKETPHEGATRETIEELGLADDVFKDALVHGDHTFSIPGSNWKYTSVAAQVPTMIKPNLTTAHARAETSDAKWMTIDEIRALDKAGSLHHPIAGGKLEQNVISLYSQGGSGVTLGQVARPGPVTKRLGRLSMPSGGRQSPASFNAWPYPHKPSKGKDLIGDKTAMDAMRQKVKQDRGLYDAKTADGRLAAIGAMQGFDDTPTVVDKKEIDRLLATGDYIEAWRGVNGAGGWSARGRGSAGGKTAADINEEMRTGPAYYGKGIFGNGYYLATQKRVATQYADGTHGSVVRLLIPKSALTKKYDEIAKESTALPRSSKAKGAGYGEISTFYDPGRYAAAKGLDGLEINPHHRAHGGGGAGHVASHGKPAFNWLNRSVLIVQKEPG